MQRRLTTLGNQATKPGWQLIYVSQEETTRAISNIHSASNPVNIEKNMKALEHFKNRTHLRVAGFGVRIPRLEHKYPRLIVAKKDKFGLGNIGFKIVDSGGNRKQFFNANV